MKWLVYYFDINRKRISTFNIFEHASFVKYVKKHLKTCETKAEFAERLRSELMYYFGSKAEWEIIIAPWVGGDREKCAIKIDVYSQVMNNFDVFLDYVWGVEE